MRIFLSRFSKGSRAYFVLTFFASLLYVIFSFLTPQIIRYTVDSIIRNGLRNQLFFCAAGIALCSLTAGVFQYLSGIGISAGTERFMKKLRDTLFHHIQYLPFSWHNAHLTGDIIQRCTEDVETIRSFISEQLLEVIRTILLIAAALVLMFSMNVTLALVFLVSVPVIILYSSLFHNKISTQFRAADEAEGDLMVDVQENLTGVRVVRAFGTEGEELSRFDRFNETFADKWIRMGGTLGLFWGIGDLATAGQLLSVVCIGSFLAAGGKMTLGELLAFISYTQTLSWPVRDLGHTLSEFSKSTVSVERLNEILDAEEEPKDEDLQAPHFPADIAFSHVNFSYGTQAVLKDLSFAIPHGTTFGILGSTGSGKSTITYLLNRLYDLPEDNGSITIGGTDIRQINRYLLRKSIGLVLQEPFLFSKTVAENIAIASSEKELPHIRHAAALSDVDENIMEFRDSYDTLVGERGVTLSGGQKQRIAIARTLMMECPILILDDSMSAVDMQTDTRIRQSLIETRKSSPEEKEQQTLILISHRISTLIKADYILVLENGCAAELGTPEELLKKDGIFRRIFDLQGNTADAEGGRLL